MEIVEKKSEITLTVREVVDSTSSLQYLANMALPAKTAFKIARLVRRVNEIVESYTEAKKNAKSPEEISELLDSEVTISLDGIILTEEDFSEEKLPPIVVENLLWALST